MPGLGWLLPLAYIFGPPILVLCVVVFGYSLHRNRLFEISRGLHSQKAFAPESALPSRASFDPVPVGNNALIGAPRLEGPAFSQALSKLISYARLVDPDWVLGVHPGGRLLSVVVAEQLGMPPNRCRFVRTVSHASKEIVLDANNKIPNVPLQGKLLVVDDITRTGDTLNLVKTFFFEKNYGQLFQFSDIRFAVLLAVVQEDELAFRPDFVSYGTNIRNFKLPWSEFSERIGTAHAEARQKSGDASEAIKQVLEDYKRIISDDEYALALAKRYIAQASSSRI